MNIKIFKIFLIFAMLIFLCSSAISLLAQTLSPEETNMLMQKAEGELVQLDLRVDLLSKILDSGEIKVGMFLNCPPLAFIDEKGKACGLNVDVASALAEELDVELKIVKIEPGEFLVSKEECDIIIPTIPKTLDLIKLFTFSQPYFQSGQVVIVNEKNSSISNYSELNTAGKKIVAIKGMTGEEVANRKFNKAGVKIASDETEALVMLCSDKADAFIYDKHFAELVCFSHPGWKMLPEQLSHDSYCIIFSKNNTNIQYFDSFVSDFKSSKKYAEIFNRWFGPNASLHR